MGLKTAPTAYQRMVSWCLARDPEIKCRPYIDDLLHGTKGNAQGQIDEQVLEEHYQSLRRLFACFRKYQLTVKREKCFLFKQRVKFCGHILEKGTRRSAPDKLQAISRWQPEHIRTPTQMKAFLGLTQWYAIYMKDYAKYAAVLSNALTGREPHVEASQRQRAYRVKWTPEMRVAFDAIKTGMQQEVVLDVANPYKNYVIRMDASKYTVGAVLEQEYSKGQLRPVTFFSRKLQGKNGLGQIGWSTREKETYALIATLHKFRSWIADRRVYVKALTDHAALVSWFREDLNTISGLIGRRGRWHEFLSQFNIEVVYTQGKHHIVPNVMSRADACMHGSEADLTGLQQDEAEVKKWEDHQIAGKDCGHAQHVRAVGDTGVGLQDGVRVLFACAPGNGGPDDRPSRGQPPLQPQL